MKKIIWYVFVAILVIVAVIGDIKMASAAETVNLIQIL